MLALPSGQEIVLLRAKAGQRCVTATGEGGSRLKIACGVAPAASAMLWIYSSAPERKVVARPHGGEDVEQLLPADTRVDLDPVIHGEPTDACVGAAPEKVIDLSPVTVPLPSDGRMPGATRELRVRVKSLGIDLPVSHLFPSLYCRTVVQARRRVSIACSTGGGGVDLSFRLREGILFVDSHSGDVDGHQSEALGGVEVGCGARLHSPRVSIRGATWSPYGDPCRAACSRARLEAEERCVLQNSDDDGELTDKGRACSEPLYNRSQVCEAAGEKKGK